MDSTSTFQPKQHGYGLRSRLSRKRPAYYEAEPALLPDERFGGFRDDFLVEEHESAYDPTLMGGYVQYRYDLYENEEPFHDMKPSEDRTMTELMGGAGIQDGTQQTGDDDEDDDEYYEGSDISDLVDDSGLTSGDDEFIDVPEHNVGTLPQEDNPNDKEWFPPSGSESDTDESDEESTVNSTDDDDDDKKN